MFLSQIVSVIVSPKLVSHSIVTRATKKKCLFKMDDQYKQQKNHPTYHPNTLNITVDYNHHYFRTRCSKFGAHGQWEYIISTVFNNTNTRPFTRQSLLTTTKNEIRSIRALDDCVKTCQQLYSNPDQNQPHKPKTFRIKVDDCNRGIGKTTCFRYTTVGTLECTIRIVLANASKQPLTKRKIGELSITAMCECTKMFQQSLEKRLRNNKNIGKQVNLEKIIKKIKSRR